ncbi:LacI family DNA-binding transcriptional regulator [Vallitalea guaymasensis]|uniref:LacI family DNA-binding transcriptional regulator n=1 Tax=Vallitalea guaymasensis TaxID=1185412 RepID=A0A8J8SA95_9FIRM|nr:LacI family DNA-binding transcriptional regulator [Vallitalea guaymasensis]QUH27548.1 LacI family DNA-binding transcriptional regulator [Vallitalea guaymasensis]
MSITIKDIAKLAGVSHATVSRALNDSPLISDKTKDRIKKIAKDNNYIPNYSAKSLKLDKSYNIGVFLSALEGTSPSFFYSSIKGVNRLMKERNYNLVVKAIDDLNGDYSIVNSKHYDGILVVSQKIQDDEFIKYIGALNIPVVVLNRKINIEGTTCVYSEDRDGAYQAVKYLTNQGHKRIGLIKGKEGFLNSSERLEGYKLAMNEASLTVDKKLIASGKFDVISGYKGMNKILDNNTELPTAMFCSNDEMAFGAIKAIIEKGLRVPEDISVVGFDDIEMCKYITPELTTVRREISKIAYSGTEILFDMLDNNSNKEFYHTKVDCKLKIRQSVHRLNQ